MCIPVGLVSLSVDGSEPVTSSEGGSLRPVWLPEVDPAGSNPVLNAAEWLQTSVRPGLTVKNGLIAVDNEDDKDGDDDVPASIQRATNQQTLLDSRTASSKWLDNKYHPQNKSVEQSRSLQALLSPSDKSSDDVFRNRTQSKMNRSLFRKVGL